MSSVGASYYFEPDFTVTSRFEEFAINNLDGGLSFNSFFGFEFKIAQKFTLRAAVAGQMMNEDTEDNEFGLSYTGLQTSILYRF